MKLQKNLIHIGAGGLAAALLFGGALLADAQTYSTGATTTTTTTTTGTSVTPGAPNTGVGGDAAGNIALLAGAAAAALGGAVYLSRRNTIRA